MTKHGQSRGAAIGLIAGASAWLAMGAAYASAARDFAETTVIDAPAGTTTTLGDFAAGDREALYKTGAGTLAVEANRLARPSDGRLTVLEGDVAITPGTATDATVPPAACQKAAFWVNPSSLVTTNGVAASEGAAAPVYASRWCDVRETDPASPTRIYAEPRWFGSTDVPALLDGVDPVVSNYNGRLAVDFGGAQSGQYMHWRLNGADCTLSGIWHLFIVHGVETCGGTPVSDESGGRDKCPLLFALFQGRTASGAWCIPGYDAYKSTTIAADRGDICLPQMSARFFLDGVATDLRNTKPRKGWQLIGADYIDVLPRADNFFRGGFRELIKGAQGGDYLGEVLVFTNRLTVAECAEITRYLLAKWRAPRADAEAQSLEFAVRAHGTQVTLAAGTAATVSGEAGTTTTPLSFAGAGSVTKTGEGTLALGPTDGLAFTGDFTWQEGALRLQGGHIPALAVAGGDVYAFTNDSHAATPSAAGDAAAGLLCTKTTAGTAGVVETTGNGWLRVHTVASDVRTVKVGSGAAGKGAVLQLEGRARQTAVPEAGPAEATIPNADFEQPFTITSTEFDRSELGDAGVNGWKGWGAHLMCVQAPQKSAGGTETWSAWLNRKPRDGTNILQIVMAGKAYTMVQVPQAGVYELSFDAKSRYTPMTYDYVDEKGFWLSDRMSQIDIQLAQNAGDVWNAAACVGTLPLGCTEFNRFHFRFAVAEAGAWTLGLKSVDSGKDSTAFFDNFRMVRVAEPERETVQEIPNGGLDRLARGAGTAEDPYVRGRYCTLNVIENWSLSVQPGVEFAAVITNGVIGAITAGTMPNTKMQLFPFASGARGAGALGFCSTGGVATATFTVPAGTWYLRGLVQTLKTYLKIGKEYDFTGTPVFHATLTRADGTVVDLGTLKVTKHELVSAFWPQTFTVAEEQQVTLTLTQETHSAFGLVDELRLTRAGATDFGNLIPGADFESDGWSSYVVSDTPATKYGSATCTAYSDRPWHWGYGVWGGLYRLKLNNAHGMARDMTIPEAGRYRFTMRLRARADKNWYANNPVRVWLAKGGVTNVLATTPTVFTRNWMEVSYGATVAEAGTWRLGIEGRCGKEDVVDAATGKETPADVEADIDDVSLVRDFDVRDAAPSLPHGLRFEVTKGATLLLDYPGTATCGPVVYDGTVYTGLISATTHPAFVTGAGALQAIPAGTVFLLR